MKTSLTPKDWRRVIDNRFSDYSPEFHAAADEVASFWKTNTDAALKEFFAQKVNELKLVKWESVVFADLITCYKNL